ncbi:protein phosphatase 4, regulatory subunit 2, partial [Podila clonocystis]
VPWEDLQKALKEKLEVAIKSAGLVYTDPFITNPITTTLAAENTSIPDLSELSAVPVTVPEASAQEESNQDEQKQEQEHEQGQEKAITEAISEATTTTTTTKESVKAEETADTPTITPVDDKVEVTAPTVSSNGPATPPRMVPVSKETLILETPAGYHARITQLLSTFTSAPFTIQRVCELLDNPTEHHSSLIKYLRAVEKVLMITSSINEFSNPVYSGPSALDGDLDSSEKKTSSNGDFSRHNLDLSLMTTATVEQEDDEEEEEEHQDERFTSTKGSTESEESLPTDTQAQAEEMDVEKPDDETDMDVDEGTASEALRENMDVDSA